MTKFSLDLSNFKKVPLEKLEHNFTFIVDNKQYRVNRFLADLLSPTITNYHYQDESIDTFTITTIDKFDKSETVSTSNEDYFESFLNLYKHDEIHINQTQIKYYSEYFLQLGNIPEYLKLQGQLFDEITTDNVIDHLLTISSILKQNHLSPSIQNDQICKLVKYCSEHFYELDKEKTMHLDLDILSEILFQDELKIEDEDTLLRFILEIYEKDKKYAPLFEYIYFENVKDEALSEFFNEFDIEFLTNGTWSSIFYRLIQSRKRPSKNGRCKNEHKFKIITKEKNNDFRGIMRYLSEECGGNIHDKGVVEITSNSYQSDSYHPKNLVDYGSNNFYAPKNQENVYVCFDFKDKQVQLTSYSIQSNRSGWGSAHLRNWVVEASNDRDNWDKIDEHSNDSTLNGYDIKATFDTKQTNMFYRYIQIRQTGVSWSSNYYTYIPYLEFFGNLKINETEEAK
ncbi:hypothetical protein M9Y10_018364 [Tritrichomonas musculus]|uniref:F5/8 type C domain-containing protein n=1 Tax=Tritrichomonas musculus TaxID=1915356 RepID=A0ABR2HPB1_9EUKA